MDNADITDALRTAVAATRGFVADDDDRLLHAFAGVQRARAERQEQRRQLLVERLGADHPEVRALTRRRARTLAVGEEVRSLARRSTGAGPVKPHEIRVAGQVVGEDGSPLAGVRVRLYDRDVVVDDLLADVTTDEAGGYSAVFHARDFHESGEQEPELYLILDDARGSRLADTRALVARESGAASMVRIVLRGRTAADLPGIDDVVSVETCVATTTKGTRCKRPARAGSSRCAIHHRDRKG